MSKKAMKPSPLPMASRGTRLTCHAYEATNVCVAGAFNGWDPATTPLARGAGGSWEVTLDLPAGRHEYKFVVDGEWCCEPGCHEPTSDCPQCVPNPFGTMNRVVEVPT